MELFKISGKATNAKQTPCYSHKSNNSISKSNKVPLIQKVVSFVKETTKFFKYNHPKRKTVLAKYLGAKLSSLCVFATSVHHIVEALEKISEWKGSISTFILRNSLSTFKFICGIYILSVIPIVTQPLSIILQKQDIDLQKGSSLIKILIMCLEEKRNKAEEQFKAIFEKVKVICVQIEVPIEKTRFERNNHIQNVEDYYRVVGYIPLIEFILEDLITTFPIDIPNVLNIPKLLPQSVIKSYTDTKLLKPQLADELIIFDKRDKHLLRSKLEPDLSDNVVDALINCDEDIYPNLRKIFQIFVSMLVSKATSGRSFPTLRRIKTWLRSTMTEDRLYYLNLPHKEITIYLFKKINLF